MTDCPHRNEYSNGLVFGAVIGAAWAYLWTAYFMGAGK